MTVRKVGNWYPTTEEEAEVYRCRAGCGGGRRACGAPTVAVLLRRHGDRSQAWAYCATHLREYGHAVRDGRVVLGIGGTP